ncbi:Protein L-Myc [Corvus brachyrhynchos]|uniref:Protein L-Myc n=1 Tax=Corvus brachyrhynchos TaxID=85066 RepID=A0A091ET78_CORBR|nr:PREDICTED: protein L-Myc [Corvus brachyrhynchos]KFO60191.1 Protein L-Myc [Corvus brachyrhynchos]
MEFDSYQHYFYDHDAQEDFHRSTAPSEDIWKKFELVPTPPLSPLAVPGEKGCCSGAEERSGWLSRYCLSGEEPEYLIGTGQIFGNLSAFILKDCMWSGFSARERLEKAMTEKLSTGTQRATPHKPSFAQDFGFSISLSECVDPAAVFLCPLAESKIPASSGSEGQSDSEGEEIDVVTVDKRQSLSLRKPVTITLRADPLDPCMKRFHISVHQQQHNYAARSPPDSCPLPESPQQDQEEDEPPGAVEPAPAMVLPEPSLPKPSSSPGSDSEDVAKRKNHNYLERKRRNDLRSRFLALRDQVPGLASCPKTPKVVILSKSSEYLQSLISAERRMAAKRQLQLRQNQLLKRIAHLKGH